MVWGQNSFCPHFLKFQAVFACGVGKCLDAAMILEAGTVEGHLGDAGRFRLLGDRLAHGARGS